MGDTENGMMIGSLKRLCVGAALLVGYSFFLISLVTKQYSPETQIKIVTEFSTQPTLMKVASELLTPQPTPISDHERSRTSLEVAKLAEALERRTVKLQNERRWPKKSLEKLDKLLTEYGKLHADILAGKVEGGKYISWVCKTWCFGWGDRIRGIMTIVTLAIIHRRAFVIELDQVGVKLNELYDDVNIRWSQKPVPKNKFHVECNSPNTRSCSCLNASIASWEPLDVISMQTNLDCAGLFAPMLPGWRDDDGGIEDVLNWKGTLMDWVFPPSLKLRSFMQHTIPQGFDVGIHIRSGFIKGKDITRFRGPPADLAKDYTDCLAKVHPDIATVYVATDNATFQAEITKSISSWTNVVDSSWIGALGHVAHDPSGGSNMVWRMMVDYEILRRAKILLVAPSGFSLYAYKTRVYADSKAYAPLKGRNTEKCERIFVNNTSKGYFVLNANL